MRCISCNRELLEGNLGSVGVSRWRLKSSTGALRDVSLCVTTEEYSPIVVFDWAQPGNILPLSCVIGHISGKFSHSREGVILCKFERSNAKVPAGKKRNNPLSVCDQSNTRMGEYSLVVTNQTRE